MGKDRTDLASATGLLLKACPTLKKGMPHAEWLEYLHTARYIAGGLDNEGCDIAARAAGCITIKEAIRKAEGKI